MYPKSYSIYLRGTIGTCVVMRAPEVCQVSIRVSQSCGLGLGFVRKPVGGKVPSLISSSLHQSYSSAALILLEIEIGL